MPTPIGLALISCSRGAAVAQTLHNCRSLQWRRSDKEPGVSLGRPIEYALSFADERSLGTVFVRRAARGGPMGLAGAGRGWSGWVEIGEARGCVRVPAGIPVGLSLRQDVEDADLVAIARLPSDALHRIACGGARIGDRSLAVFSRQSALEELDLTLNTQVRDESLEHLGGLEHLRVLVLQGCRSLTDKALAPVSRMLQLRDLDLGFLPLTDASLTQLAPLTSLECLDFTECRSLTAVGIAHLAGLTSLRTLSLDQCSGLGAGTLSHVQGLTRLVELRLQGTSIDDQDIKHLHGLAALEVLCLGGTNLSDDGLATVGAFTRLRHLCLSGERITDAAVQHIKGLVNLTGLDLSQSSITDEGLAGLSTLTDLESLDLGWGDRLNGTGFAALQGLPRLESVDLAGSRALTDAGIRQVARLPYLRTLNLDQTNVSDDAVELLSGVRTLQELTLRSTRVTGHGIQRLRSRLPGCTVKASRPG